MNISTIDNENILLIIDDEEDIRLLLKSIFQHDFIVLDAADGLAGLALANEHLPNIIISDIMMPKMDGFDFCKTIKENEKTSHIPIILLTAKTDLESKLQGLQLGATDYIVKPFLIEELKSKMNNLIALQQNAFKYLQAKLLQNKNEIDIDTTIEEGFLTKLKEVLGDNYNNQKFDVDTFASILHISQVQLRRKIRALTNLTAVEFIRKYRLQKSEELLRKQDISITEIAYAVGYDSISYFSKVFQEEYKKSPSEFRNSI